MASRADMRRSVERVEWYRGDRLTPNVAQKGLMAPATARARKAAVSKVLAILDDQEAEDVTALNIDDVMSRFAHLQGRGYNPQSLVTYKSWLKSALEDFSSYISNPLAFRPNVQSRERRPAQAKAAPGVNKAPAEIPSPEPQPRTVAMAGPMSNSILPIPIRSDLTIYIQGLPFDLTDAEAKKIAGVVQAMATPI
jgi:hypothetical protein